MSKIGRLKNKIDKIIEKISIDELVNRIEKDEVEDIELVFTDEIFREGIEMDIIENEYSSFNIHSSARTSFFFNIFSKYKKEKLYLEEAA